MTPPSWSEDDIILAIWEWNEDHGEPPKWHEWQFKAEGRPTSMTVRAVFGSWNAAIERAGFEPRPNTSAKPVQFDIALARKMRKEGLSDSEIARRLGVSQKSISRKLGPRPKPKPVRKNRTREQRIADLKEALRKED